MKNKRTTKNLAFAGMFMALTMVFTVIHIPLAIGNINFGDAVILLSAACLPLPFSVASSAIGAALADVFTGYASYAPFTLVVKALVALIAKLMLTALKNAKPAVKYPISAIPAELVMAGGYFWQTPSFSNGNSKLPQPAFRSTCCRVLWQWSCSCFWRWWQKSPKKSVGI